MFSDFDPKAESKEGRGRRTVSLLLAAGLFIGIGAALAAAIATAHQIVREEREIDVSFAELDEPLEMEPEPEPEPETQPPPRRPQAAAASRVDAPPTSIPDARPAESEGELAEAGDVGPIDGVLDGDPEGSGEVELPPEPPPPPPPEPPPGPPRRPRPPPRQERVEVARPTLISGCSTPARPDTLDGQTAETLRIRVRVVVAPDGSVLRATVTDGHPLIPDETILECIQTRVFEPATLEGTPVPYVFTYVFTFRPDVL